MRQNTDLLNIEFIKALVTQSQVLVSLAEAGETATFIEGLSDYDSQLDKLNQVLENLPPKSSREVSDSISSLYSEALENFQDVYQKLVRVTNELKESTASELKTLHNKANGMKKYLGISETNEPINLTGIRKG
jgi:DNA mismatch repair ATPase MutS